MHTSYHYRTHTGQSNSSGVNIIAVIISVVVIVLILCLSMPICIICLVVALVCTCTRYKKAKQSPHGQTTDSKTGGNLLPQTSIHHLPLPPIPTSTGVEENAAAGYYEYTSELNVEANRAYGTNLTNDAKDRAVYETSMTTDANRAYSSNLTTDRAYYEVNSVTEADQAYELDDIGVIGSDSDLKIEANRAAYGSNLTTEPDRSYYEVNSVTEADQAYELDDIVAIGSNSDLKTEANRAYGSKLSAEPVNNEAAASSQSTTARVHVRAPVVPTEENIAYGQHNQLLAEETDMYEYI